MEISMSEGQKASRAEGDDVGQHLDVPGPTAHALCTLVIGIAVTLCLQLETQSRKKGCSRQIWKAMPSLILSPQLVTALLCPATSKKKRSKCLRRWVG